MSANLSVQIVHSEPSPEPHKPCLFCVHGQGQFQFKNSSATIKDVFGIDLKLLSKVPAVDQLFCQDCKMVMGQMKTYRQKVQKMYHQMCTIFEKKTKLQEALLQELPNIHLSFSLPSAVLTVGSDGADENPNVDDKESSASQASSFVMTLNVHMDEGDSEREAAQKIIDSQLVFRPLFSPPLDSLFDKTNNSRNSDNGHNEESSSEPEEWTLPDSVSEEKPSSGESKSRKSTEKMKATEDSTPMRRTRGIKLDFTSIESGRKPKTGPPQNKEQKVVTNKETVQCRVTPRRPGRPPKKLLKEAVDTGPSKNKRTPKTVQAEGRVLPGKRKAVEVSDDESDGVDGGVDSLEPDEEEPLDDKSEIKLYTNIKPASNNIQRVSRRGRPPKRKAASVDDGVDSVEPKEEPADNLSEVKLSTSTQSTSNSIQTVRKRGRPPKSKTVLVAGSHPGTPEKTADSILKELGWKNNIADYEIVVHLIKKYSENYHVLPEPYECGACGDLFAELEVMQEHIINKHEDTVTDSQSSEDSSQLFKCASCSKEFMTAEELYEHCQSHGNKKDLISGLDALSDPKCPSTCTICERKVNSLKDLARHIINIHQVEDSRNFECDTCHKKFYLQKHLQEHRIMHESSYPYVCEHCGWPYKRQHDYKMHLLTHTGTKFLCSMCGMEFRNQYSLNLHKYTRHKEHQTFQCQICYREVKENKHILKHVCINSRKKELLVEKIDKSGRPFYTCQTCGESYNTKCSLTAHMLKLAHVPLQPGELAQKSSARGQQSNYTCPKCEMSFVTIKDAKRHIASRVCVRQPFVVTEEGLKKEEDVAVQSDTMSQVPDEDLGGVNGELDSHEPREVIDGVNDLDKPDIGPSASTKPISDDVQPVLTAKRGRPPKHKTKIILNSKPPEKTAESFLMELGWNDDASDYEIVAGLMEKYSKNSHVLPEPYECGACGELFDQLESMKEHISSKHEDGETETLCSDDLSLLFKCASCSSKFETAEELYGHCQIHGNKKDFTSMLNTQEDPKAPRSCSICGKAVSSLRELAKHILNAHHENKNFECDICHRKFGRLSHLQAHLVTHESTHSYICEFCGWSYKRPHEYNMHLLTHTGKGFLCGICGLEFKNPFKLKRHKYNMHKEHESFKCQICYREVKANKHILKHSCMHPRRQELLIEKIDKNGRPFYVCHTCGESYNTKCLLAAHMLKVAHFPLKPGELAGNWRKKIAMDRQEKKYNCSKCGASFPTAKEARRHKRRKVCVTETPEVKEEELRMIVQDEDVALLDDTNLVRCKEEVMGQFVFCTCPKCHCLLVSLTVLREHMAECLAGDSDTVERGNDDNDDDNKHDMFSLLLSDGQKIPGQDLPEYSPATLGPKAEKFVKKNKQLTSVKRSDSQNDDKTLTGMIELTVTEEIEADEEMAEIEADEEMAEIEADEETVEEKTVIPATTYLCGACNAMFGTLEEVHSHVKNDHQADIGPLVTTEPQTFSETDALIFAQIEETV